MRKFSLIIILLLSFISSAIADGIRLKTDKETYLRYEHIDITCEYPPLKNSKFLNIPLISGTPANSDKIKREAECTAKIFLNNSLVRTVGNTTEIKLRYKKEKDAWFGRWPIPWNPDLGRYHALVILKINGKKYAGQVNFNVTRRIPRPMDKGFCVMDIEPGDSIIQRVPGVGGKAVKIWENYLLWAKFMGASALWHNVGQSQLWGDGNYVNPSVFPWDACTLDQIGELADACHKYDMKYGGWITSFVVLGPRQDLSPYKQTTGYDKETNTLRKLIYISITDEKRKQDIIDLLKKMNDTPNVDFVGMDYIRTDFGGYEMASEFADDMPLKILPMDWGEMTEEDRELWLGKTLEIDHDPDTWQMWMWWRAHKMATILAEIKQRAGLTKQFWVYTLTWKMGREHGQDPLMFIDAGVDINALMFYSIDKNTYPLMLSDWHDYLKKGNTNMLAGQCVDWNLLGRTYKPAGPEEHYIRQKMAVDKFLKINPLMGLFWHDLTRAFKGSRGPYSAIEWAIGGAASFSYLRDKEGVFPFEIKWDCPDRAAQGEVFTIDITIKNKSVVSSEYYLKLLKVSNLEMYGDITQRFFLAPGEIKSFSFQVKAMEREYRKDYMQMIAFMLQYNGLSTQERYFDFKYIEVR
jgi:hypothetical protein